MHYVHQNFIIKALQHNLQNAIYEPILVGHHYSAPFYPRVTLHKHTSTSKFKYALQALGLMALSLPIGATVPATPLDALDHIQLSDHLHIASDTSDDFAMDIAKRYGDTLGVDVDASHFADKKTALEALTTGEVDFLVTNTKPENNELRQQYASCHLGDENALFVFRADDERLARHAKDYLCQSETLIANANIAKFYDRHFLNDYSRDFFDKTIKHSLPLYQFAFETYAKQYDHDWRLLVAVAYQESQLNPNVISPTGVQGIMMLTRDTASAMGVSDRTDPTQSIQGGAKYLHYLQGYFDDVPENERLWFVLAGYNMGPNAVRNVQEKIRTEGKNPNLWGNFYDYLARHVADNRRYGQCMHYVTGVRHYLRRLHNRTI